MSRTDRGGPHDTAGDHLPAWVRQVVDALPEAARLLDAARPPGRRPSRAAAVLVCFSPGEPGARGEQAADLLGHVPGDVLVIERASTLRTHAGQPAFPGGAVDSGDDGPVAAALREAQEETGLDPAGVVVLGTLPDLYLPPSGFCVTPVLAWEPHPSAVSALDPGEVVRAVRVPVADLVDPARRVRVAWTSPAPAARTGAAGSPAPAADGVRMLGPGFEVGGMLVWGFTAMVLSALLAASGLERPWAHARTVPAPLEPLEPGAAVTAPTAPRAVTAPGEPSAPTAPTREAPA